ncbi:MAG: type III-B CRISPR module-associated Cmr3 family protein [Bacteroidota bacterium]
MSRSTYHIHPLDTLFFKDGKPFSLGEETWADGIFPPPPSVLTGAFRTAWLSRELSLLNQLQKGKPIPDWLLNLHLTQVGITINRKPYLPIPLDLAQPKVRKMSEKIREKSRGTYRAISSVPLESEAIHSLPDPLSLWGFTETVEGWDHQLISAGEDFSAYLSGNKSQYKSTRSLQEIVKMEAKIGIGRSPLTNSAEDGQLYRTGMRRMSPRKGDTYSPGFVVEVEGMPDMLQSKPFLIKLGAEGKAARVIPTQQVEWPHPPATSSVNQFKLIFSTPVFFDNPKHAWLPSWLESDQLSGTLPGTDIPVQLTAAFTGKPIVLGGWDLVNQRPKPMRNCLPAGTVLHFKFLEQQHHSLLSLREKLPVSLSENDPAQQGFGLYYLGMLAH